MYICNPQFYFADWNNLIIGKFSPFINVDSTNPIIRKNSEEALNQELSLVSHFGLSGATLKLKHGINKNVNLARIISDKISNNNTNFQVTTFILITFKNCFIHERERDNILL